ncbi:hypothetical protein TRVL_04296 [Trypanosoma vivax]|nr:hypothetical protein TRVL_04296 [Trypanosoma vivax]
MACRNECQTRGEWRVNGVQRVTKRLCDTVSKVDIQRMLSSLASNDVAVTSAKATLCASKRRWKNVAHMRQTFASNNSSLHKSRVPTVCFGRGFVLWHQVHFS